MQRSRIASPFSLLFIFTVAIYIIIGNAAPKQRNTLKKKLLEHETRILESTAISSSSSSSRGGLRARLGNAESQAAAEASEPKPWTQTLKRDWAAGKISAAKVQEYAEKSAAQGAQGLDAVAAAGTHGKHPSSVHRKLMSIFGNPKGAPEIDWVEIPTKNGRVAHPFLFPHKFLKAMYEERFPMFVQAFRGPEGAARQFWEALLERDNPFVKNHPLLTADAYDHAIPIGMHGDAGAFTKHDSLMVISWNSLLGAGPTKVKRFVFTFIRKADYCKASLDRIWELLAWSVNAMARGTMPELDWDGKPTMQQPSALAGPHTAVLTQVRGGTGSFMLKSSGSPLGTERYACAGYAVRHPRLSRYPSQILGMGGDGVRLDSRMNLGVHG